MKSYSFIWGLLLSVSVATVLVSEMVHPEVHVKLLNEGGWIESASWVSYFIAAGFLLIQTIRWPSRWSMLVITMVLGMRELDFDKRFTTMGVFKSRFYFSDQVPVIEKLIAGVITAALVAVLVLLVKAHLKPFIEKVKNREGASLSVLFSCGLMAVTKSIDGLSRKLEPFGIEPSAAANRVVGAIEETFELTAAVLLILASAMALRQRSK